MLLAFLCEGKGWWDVLSGGGWREEDLLGEKEEVFELCDVSFFFIMVCYNNDNKDKRRVIYWVNRLYANNKILRKYYA